MSYRGRAQHMLERAAELHASAATLAEEIQRFDFLTQQADVRDLVAESRETLLAIARILSATADQFEVLNREPEHEPLIPSTPARIRDLARLLRAVAVQPFDGVLDALPGGTLVIIDRQGDRIPSAPEGPASGTRASLDASVSGRDDPVQPPGTARDGDGDRRRRSEGKTPS